VSDLWVYCFYILLCLKVCNNKSCVCGSSQDVFLFFFMLYMFGILIIIIVNLKIYCKSPWGQNSCANFPFLRKESWLTMLCVHATCFPACWLSWPIFMTFGTSLECSLTSYILVPNNQNNLKLQHHWEYFIQGLNIHFIIFTADCLSTNIQCSGTVSNLVTV
jgi:hypothetical protein